MDGSSRMRISGSAISARPTATICCSPPDIVEVCWSARLRSTGNRSMTLSRRSSTTCFGTLPW